MDDDEQVRTAAQQLLRRLGPLPPSELIQHVRDAGHAEELDPHELRQRLLGEVDETGEPVTFSAFPLADGRLCDLDHLVDGLVVTHVLTDAERERGEAELDPDLTVTVLASVDGRAVPLAGGGELVLTQTDALRGPAGWLPDQPVLTLRLTLEGVVIGGLDRLPDADVVVADRLAEVFAYLDDIQPFAVDVPQLLLEARARYPKLLHEPARPLGELLETAGLAVTAASGLAYADEIDGLDAGPYDDDAWLGDELDDELVEHLLHDHAFEASQVIDLMQVHNAAQHGAVTLLRRLGDVLEQVVEAVDADRDLTDVLTDVLPRDVLRQVLDEPPPVEDEEAVRSAFERLLAATPLTTAVLHDGVGDDALLAATTLALLDGLELDLDRRARANRHWLRARLVEFVADDHAAVEPELRRALDLDEAHGEAIFDLARYRCDRGEAGAALGLLRQLEASGGDDHWVDLLERYAQPGPTSAGRNDPCPCGSGRKHKVCCARRNGWPLADRMPWVYEKVVRYLVSEPAAAATERVLEVVGDELAEKGWSDIVLTNIVLFDGGVLEEFADRRGSLLPADELELLRAFAQVRAGAYEVVEVEPGQGLALLDQRDGERIELTDVSLSHDVEVGDLLLAWIVPGPHGPEPSGGGVTVPSRARAALLALIDLAPDADALAMWYDRLHAPPKLRNTEGEPLVMTTLEYRLPDPEAARHAVAAALAAEGEGGEEHGGDDLNDPLHTADDEDGDDLVLPQTFVGEGGQLWLRGTLRFADDTLTVETNSTVRADRLRRLVQEAVPDAVLVDESRLPFEELAGRAGGEGGPGASAGIDLDELDEEERAGLEAAVDRFMDEYEEQWVDRPVPALGGATPRQAASDPTRRDDLERLLREFQPADTWSGPGRPMDPDRLRRLLDL